jgi:hypothetical protein
MRKITETGCWEFPTIGWLNDAGYRVFRADWQDAPERLHRFMYWLFNNGRLPENPFIVMHTCDNRQCCNPEHLVEGTRGLNVKDAAAKNRMPIGKKHWNCKLSPETVEEILSSRQTNAVLARRFGVSAPYISRLRSGQRRKKLDSE